jgi:hypothetical protein
MKRGATHLSGFLRCAVTVLAAASLAAPAFAQLARGAEKVLNESEVRQALLGIDMEGYSPSYGFSWRECIDPKGDTLYETPTGQLKGKLTIESDGYACFSYEDDNFAEPACFRVKRGSKGMTFNGLFADVFVTTRVITGVKSCTPRDDLVG